MSLVISLLSFDPERGCEIDSARLYGSGHTGSKVTVEYAQQILGSGSAVENLAQQSGTMARMVQRKTLQIMEQKELMCKKSVTNS